MKPPQHDLPVWAPNLPRPVSLTAANPIPCLKPPATSLHCHQWAESPNMVYNGCKPNIRQKSIRDILHSASNTAQVPHTPITTKRPGSAREAGDSEYDSIPQAIPNIDSQPDILHQFKRMLTKALKATSDSITNKWTCEIWTVGCCTYLLKQRTEELDLITCNHSEELETLWELNSPELAGRFWEQGQTLKYLHKGEYLSPLWSFNQL